MNVFIPGVSLELTVIIREITLTDNSKFLFEFTEPGGKIYIGDTGRGIVVYSDTDAPAVFPVSMINKAWKDKDQAQVNIYHLPDGITEAITAAHTALEASPTADSSMTLAKALNDLGVDFELIYRGLVYCTSETVYFPYNPIADEYETIEKAATIYKTR